MKYYTRPDAVNATKERVEMLRTYAGLIPIIKKVIISFDGKVFNCKLEKAINDATGQYFTVKKEHNHITIYTYNRGSCQTFGRLAFEDMADGKRINAAKFCESLNENRAEMLREAAALEVQLADIDNIIARFDQLKKIWDNLAGSLEYAILDNFSIKRYL